MNSRTAGLAGLALGGYLLWSDAGLIARTGHGGRKSAVIPLIISMSASFVVDPDAQRPGIMATMLLAGAAAGVFWFFRWG